MKKSTLGYLHKDLSQYASYFLPLFIEIGLYLKTPCLDSLSSSLPIDNDSVGRRSCVVQPTSNGVNLPNIRKGYQFKE
jgi:hypothetical protein